jgi:lactate/malate dehydrogenase, alpha/beta C-terminal domain
LAARGKDALPILKALSDGEAVNKMERSRSRFGCARRLRSGRRNARGASSAASAANAAIDHMRDWLHGTDGRWVSMGIASNGNYGIPEGLICGVPVTCSAGAYRRVDGLEIDDFARSMIDRTIAELKEELAAVQTGSAS